MSRAGLHNPRLAALSSCQVSTYGNEFFGSEQAEGGGNPLFAGGAAAAAAGGAYGAAQAGKGDTSAENPMFGMEDGGVAGGNPLFGGGDDSPTALGQVKTRGDATFANAAFGGDDEEGGAANPIFGGDGARAVWLRRSSAHPSTLRS
jgi:hypothetical protein